MKLEGKKTKLLDLAKPENKLLSLMISLEECSGAKEIVANYPNLNEFQRDLAIKSICLGFNCLSKNNAKLILKNVFLKNIEANLANEIFNEFFNVGKSLKNMDALSFISKNGDTDDMKYLLQINDKEYSNNQKIEVSKAKELEEKSDKELLEIIGVKVESN